MKQGWEIKKLGEVCTFQRGLTYSKEDEVEHSNNCVLRSNNISLETMSIILDELKYVREDLVVSEEKKVKPNTILVCMSNGSKQHIGKVAFIDKAYDYAFGGFMGLITPIESVCPKYVYYSCVSQPYKHFLSGIGNGANITNLKFSDLSQFVFPIPPREEQERIVEELDCLSGVIVKKREQLKELDALAQSIFYQMFGDPITNEKGWEVKKLGEVCVNLFAGGDVPKNNFSEVETDEYNVPILSNGVGDKALYGFTNIAKVKDVSLTISGRGTIGYCAIRQTPFFPVVRLIVATPNSSIILPIVLKYNIDCLSLKGTGGAIPQLTIPMVRDKEVILPPIALQQEFADKIEAIEKQKELIKQSITQTEELFNSRMDYYFNG